MEQRGTRKTLAGNVISNKMEKTVVIQVESVKTHPLYKKQIKTFKKYKVHDEKNECNVGDKVEIVETRPLSKEKRWRLAKIVQKAVS